MPINRFLATLLLFPALAVACRKTTPPPEAEIRPDSTVVAAAADSGLVVCTGRFEAPRNARVAVTAPASGRVIRIGATDGCRVSRGATLFVVEDPAFLKLQQEYLECLYQLDFYSEDLKRQGELALEKAASLKKLQETELAYNLNTARKSSLEKQLALLGIAADSIPSRGLTSEIIIKAPSAGVFEQQIQEGTYIGPEIVLAFLRINKPVVLYADLPDSCYGSVAVHQQLAFSLPGEGREAHPASIAFIDDHVNPETGCFRVRLDPGTRTIKAVPGMQVTVYLRPGLQDRN